MYPPGVRGLEVAGERVALARLDADLLAPVVHEALGGGRRLYPCLLGGHLQFWREGGIATVICLLWRAGVLVGDLGLLVRLAPAALGGSGVIALRDRLVYDIGQRGRGHQPYRHHHRKQDAQCESRPRTHAHHFPRSNESNVISTFQPCHTPDDECMCERRTPWPCGSLGTA